MYIIRIHVCFGLPVRSSFQKSVLEIKKSQASFDLYSEFSDWVYLLRKLQKYKKSSPILSPYEPYKELAEA